MRLAEFEKIAELLARQHKIQVKEGAGWAANIKERHVFYKKEDIYSLPENHLLGLLLHEIAHIHYTTDAPYNGKFPALRHSIMNSLEDHAIEHIISFDYPNAGEILEETKEEVLDTLVRILPTINVSRHEKALLYASARFEGRGYAKPMLTHEVIGEKIAKLITKKRDEILNRKETKDLQPIVQEVMDILLQEIGEPSQQEEDSLASSEGTIGENHTTEKAKDAVMKSIGKNQGHGDFAGDGRIKIVDNISDQGPKIGKKLRSIMKINNAMEFGGRFRTGKLKTKNLARIRTVKDRRPFGRRIVKSNKSYAFSIATDVSGSMFSGFSGIGHKSDADISMSSLHMASQALRIAGIPRSLVMFGDRAILISPSTKRDIPWREINDNKKMNKTNQGGTDISKAIHLYGFHRLIQTT